MNRLQYLIFVLITAFSSSSLFALPIFRSMISARKNILVNCTLCHKQDNWDLTKFGKDFLVGGYDFKTLDQLEKTDSDQDGFTTAEEWKAGSNPGDPASTPQRPGNWLKEAKPALAPKKILTPLFAGEITYRVQEDPLSEPLLQEIEKFLGTKLRDEDKYPSLFWVEQNKMPIGVAAYCVSPSAHEELNVFLVVMKGDKIEKLHPNHVHTKPLKDKKFLNQFTGKTLEDLAQILPSGEAKKESSDLIESVKKTVFILKKRILE